MNCSQINNTTIKGTSAVTYDSTPLPCTDVTTCDGLNDILSKFDAVICDVKASVDSITEDVINLTEDIMIITEDIININNQLNICCPTTTTTSSSSTSTTTTTTLIPTTTTTTTLEPTTTTTTTLIPTTTTTTTIVEPTTTTTTTSGMYACICYDLVSLTPPSGPFLGSTTFKYFDCNNIEQSIVVNEGEIASVCAKEDTVVQWSGDPGSISISMIDCCNPTTTTTTTVASLQEGLRSSSSVFAEEDACPLPLVITAYFEGFSRVYDDLAGLYPFNGGGQYWRFKTLASSDTYSAMIDSDGYIVGSIGICI